MAKYQPIKIAGMSTGLVQDREEFILPNDAYPVLENAFVWRERLKRKRGCELLGRLKRQITITAPNNTNNLLQGLESSASLVPGSLSVIGSGGTTWTDPGEDGVLVPSVVAPNGTVNYATGVITGPTPPNTGTFSYYPNLPVCGILNREIDSKNNEESIFFDTTYAYRYSGGTFSEFIPGTTWHGTDYQLFWGTNYWVNASNVKLMWVTNFNIDQATKDPIRYTDGTTWTSFAPTINAAGDVLAQALALLPFRGRLLAFNTYEGPSLVSLSSLQYRQRIRWSAIGSPLTADSWRDDIRGQGGFLDIPTNQDIISVGFVRDNLVIYCERSTWQLRYTGRSIAPFQIERVNAELGTESTFSSVQFDTSLVGFGDKAIVECDSFKSAPIDIKIPDLVFSIENQNHGNDRVVGIRDFQQRLAYWMFPITIDGYTPKFPNRRLVYNYENDSWALFQDCFTYFGNFQADSGKTWAQSVQKWKSTNEQWGYAPALFPFIVAGNQQGFIEILDQDVTNEETLYISNVSGTTVTVITSPEHNLASDQVIQLTNMIGDMSSLNNKIAGVKRTGTNTFEIYEYNSSTQDFDIPIQFPGGTYIGKGTIIVRDGFKIQSKKFNFLDEGQNIQLGYIDILMDSTSNGSITMNVYADYNMAESINTLPENVNDVTNQPDTFFNSVIPTYKPTYGSFPSLNSASTKNWQRIFCPTRASFLTTQFTLSNEQLNGDAQGQDVQIDCQIMYVRKAGNQLAIGI